MSRYVQLSEDQRQTRRVVRERAQQCEFALPSFVVPSPDEPENEFLDATSDLRKTYYAVIATLLNAGWCTYQKSDGLLVPGRPDSLGPSISPAQMKPLMLPWSVLIKTIHATFEHCMLSTFTEHEERDPGKWKEICSLVELLAVTAAETPTSQLRSDPGNEALFSIIMSGLLTADQRMSNTARAVAKFGVKAGIDNTQELRTLVESSWWVPHGFATLSIVGLVSAPADHAINTTLREVVDIPSTLRRGRLQPKKLIADLIGHQGERLGSISGGLGTIGCPATISYGKNPEFFHRYWNEYMNKADLAGLFQREIDVRQFGSEREYVAAHQVAHASNKVVIPPRNGQSVGDSSDVSFG